MSLTPIIYARKKKHFTHWYNYFKNLYEAYVNSWINISRSQLERHVTIRAVPSYGTGIHIVMFGGIKRFSL